MKGMMRRHASAGRTYKRQPYIAAGLLLVLALVSACGAAPWAATSSSPTATAAPVAAGATPSAASEASTSLPDRPGASTSLPDRPEAATAAPQQAASAAPDASTAVPTAAGDSTAGSSGDVYIDPEARFRVPLPIGWSAEQRDGFAVLSDPEQLITAYARVVDNVDPAAAVAEAWRLVDPAFALEPAEVQQPPALNGIEQVVAISYDAGNEQRVLTGHAQLYRGLSYVLLMDADSTALQRRAAQAEIIRSGYTISALPQVDLRAVAPARVDAAVTDELRAFTERMLERFEVPGAAVAVVQDGEVVYLDGFGVRNAATNEAMTPQTRMLIGSTGKSLTTMLMATLVDNGTMDWDTPAQQILPSFAVHNPALSAQITMRNLVCACTGVPRRDLELIFNANNRSAEETVASLSSFEFYTPIGEVYQYSNQMVASGGYLAALADQGAGGGLLEDYDATLRARVLDPIGMSNTTLSFAEVEQSDNYAVPHSRDLAVESTYQARPLDIERVLVSDAPAGAHWSTAEDMARYLITELNRGVAPDGTRVVSAHNLQQTWQGQVPVDATTQYGLGWYVGNYKQQPLIHHGGNTLGFTSDFAFLPDADLGIVVLSNGQASNAMNEAIRTRLWELVFAQPAEAETIATYQLEQVTIETAAIAGQIGDTLDAEAIRPFLGRYSNDALGPMSLLLLNDALVLDSGEFRSHLKPLRGEDGTQAYVMVDPPVAGLMFTFENDETGSPTMVLAGFGLGPYMFTGSDAAEAASTVPILVADTLLGGVQGGDWLGAPLVAPLLQGGERYRVLSGDQAAETSAVGSRPTQSDPLCADVYTVSLEPAIAERAVAVGGDWPVQPRQPKELPEQTGLDQAVVTFLQGQGIAQPKVRIARAARIDLEGDGSDEVVIAATRLTPQDPTDAAAGDYSFVAVQKTIDGTPRLIELAGNYFPQVGDFAAPNEYRVRAVLDLNGDGVLEIVVDETYYEGAYTRAIGVEGATARTLLTAGCGA